MLKLTPDTPDARHAVLEILAELETRRGTRVLCFYQDHRRGDEELGPAALEEFRAALATLGETDRVSVLIESPGGDIHAAYQMLKLLRARASYVEVLISNWAKSAATFFCLGADRIIMAETAEMGPLDAQLSNPRGSWIFSSALNSFKSLEYLRQYALETLDYVLGYLTLGQTSPAMDYPYALQYAQPIVNGMISPLFEQVNPHQLGEARLQLAVAEEYTKRVMSRYSYRDWSPSQVNKVVRQLVWDYPIHSFVIDLDEAQSLGLRAERMDGETSDLCERLLQTVSGCVGVRPTPTTSELPAAMVAGDLHENGH